VCFDCLHGVLFSLTRLAGQDIPRLLCKPKPHYRVYKVSAITRCPVPHPTLDTACYLKNYVIKEVTYYLKSKIGCKIYPFEFVSNTH
jgi:hypothetical protein